ncbi:hypothetical protein DM860_018063 [Cuscuta australis]|uniref:HMA domain-containing protein n=1 Tax=Cuscuta australis TaxID=267555 RepID=A0A328DEG8_9ASTE|nr:hypothetical protein DM860_018063 [Cuscuta australis]
MGEEKKPADEVKQPSEKTEHPPSAAGGDEKKAAEESKAPPRQEVVLRVFMHCEGCARKVRRCLKDLEGVEDVVTDWKTHKIVVKGEKADPLKVLERLQRKSHRQVELISSIPKPAAAEEPLKPPEPEEKKPEVFAVVLKAHMHCEACAEAIKRKILKMKGVESVEPDFKSSQVTVNGALDPQTLADYVAKKTGKRVVVVKAEPKTEEKKPAVEEEESKSTDDKGEKKESNAGGGAACTGAKLEEEGKEDPKLELRKYEAYHYYQVNHPLIPQQGFAAHQEGHGHGHGYGYGGYPQMFSDENPNACSVM